MGVTSKPSRFVRVARSRGHDGHVVEVREVDWKPISWVSDGCTAVPDGWPALAPAWARVVSWKPACCAHDLLYGIGGEEVERRRADHVLYRRIKGALVGRGRLVRTLCGFLVRRRAVVYYLGVRDFGDRHFNYRQSSDPDWYDFLRHRNRIRGIAKALEAPENPIMVGCLLGDDSDLKAVIYDLCPDLIYGSER